LTLPPQRGCDDLVLSVPPTLCAPFHWPRAAAPRLFELALPDFGDFWSGAVDPERVADLVLKLRATETVLYLRVYAKMSGRPFDVRRALIYF
jgi:hypothetical protein